MQSDESGRIAAICRKLATDRYIPRIRWVRSKGSCEKSPNPDYAIADSNREQIRERLELVGFEISFDPAGNFVKATPIDEADIERNPLSKDEILVFLTLAALYGESKGRMGLYGTVETTVGELQSIMMGTYGLTQDKPMPTSTIGSILRGFALSRIVAKPAGSWSSAATTFSILPTITDVLPLATAQGLMRRYTEKAMEFEAPSEYQSEKESSDEQP